MALLIYLTSETQSLIYHKSTNWTRNYIIAKGFLLATDCCLHIPGYPILFASGRFLVTLRTYIKNKSSTDIYFSGGCGKLNRSDAFSNNCLMLLAYVDFRWHVMSATYWIHNIIIFPRALFENYKCVVLLFIILLLNSREVKSS